MAVVVGGRAGARDGVEGADVKGVGVCGDGSFVVVVVLAEEQRGVKCEGRCCRGAGGEEQLVYHHAGFGGETQEGGGIVRHCGILDEELEEGGEEGRLYIRWEGKVKVFHGFYGCVGR